MFLLIWNKIDYFLIVAYCAPVTLKKYISVDEHHMPVIYNNVNKSTH